MHIVLCADDKYVIEARKCIKYLRITQKNMTVHILGCDLSEDNVSLLSNDNINVVRFKDHDMLGKFWDPHFLKLFIPNYFPTLDRAIYLDTDTIVLRRLTPLWDMDLEENYAAGVIRIGARYAESMIGYGPYHYSKYGLKPNTKMMNMGVMILNLKKFRDSNILSALLRLTKEALTYFTQSMTIKEALKKIQNEEFAFNLLMNNLWLEIPEKWNVVPKSKVRIPYIIHTLH